jgi:hypothetical protein
MDYARDYDYDYDYDNDRLCMQTDHITSVIRWDISEEEMGMIVFTNGN